MNESAEQRLRRGLHALVVDPVPAPPAAAAVRAGRALRRRRRVTVTLAGVAVLAVAAVPVLNRLASPAGGGGQPAAAGSHTPSTDPSRLPVVHDSGGDGIERGPKQAEIGTPYPFDLFVHCGIQYAEFSGALWQADPVQPNYRPKTIYRGLNYVQGTMTLVAPGEARFDGPAEGLHVTFRPQTGQREGCD
ncbi:hypothetical protein [Dactylosporangium salmoneum]|uniref:Uncharacterized protein n=1 Tax=Dactylosporangium salmoneum TaxID=53361 RepID=A0ABN3FGT4_9ACTN